MQIEQSVKPVSQGQLKYNSQDRNESKETFHAVFQRTLNNRSNSRPPGIELKGILIPLPKENWLGCGFKIETDQAEYFLRMNDSKKLIAKRLSWEEVFVKGYMDEENGLIEVERISLLKINEPLSLSLTPIDLPFEIEQYKQTIRRSGKIDIAAEI